MEKKLIARLTAFYAPAMTPGGRGTLAVSGDCLLEEQRMFAELEHRCRGQPYAVEITVRPVRDRRTLDQNRLMWAMLNKMALALSGDTPGSVTAEQCYLDLLQDYGAGVEVYRVPYASLPLLRRAYRVVQLLELLEGGDCMVRLGEGSSAFDKRQMHDFLERIFDRLAEMGVDDAETVSQYRDWRAADGLC